MMLAADVQLGVCRESAEGSRVNYRSFDLFLHSCEFGLCQSLPCIYPLLHSCCGGQMRSLRALLEGDRVGAALAVGEHKASGMRDPESLFYVARHMARIDELGRAIEILFRVIDQNFVCDFSLAHDPWLSSLRSHPQYGDRSILYGTLQVGRAMGNAGLKIVLGRDGGTVSARVADKDGNPTADCTVVVMPATAPSEAVFAAMLITVDR